MGKTPIRIILADDHTLFREGIIKLLNNPQFNVIDDVEDGQQLIASYIANRPDLIIADISMPNATGLQAFANIKSIDPDVKALFLSMHTEDIYYYSIYRLGGKGLVDKNINGDELQTAIITIMSGELYFGKKFDKENLEEQISKLCISENIASYGHVELSSRELDVLKLIRNCKSNVEIANELFLSIRTVEKHRENIIKKAGVKNYMELFKFAEEYLRTREILIIK